MTEDQKVEDVIEEAVVAEEPKKPAVKKAAKPAEPEFVLFESREKEPSMFVVAGINPIRNFSSGRLEWEVPAADVERFSQNHFVMNARVVRKG
jgi:hypothetical protein